MLGSTVIQQAKSSRPERHAPGFDGKLLTELLGGAAVYVPRLWATSPANRAEGYDTTATLARILGVREGTARNA